MWLWRVRRGLAFHAGYRVADFHAFETPDQFAPGAAALAERAAREVVALRQKFGSLDDIYRYLVAANPQGNAIYDTAVVAGLVGDTATARRLFGRIEDAEPSSDWQSARKAGSTALAALVHDAGRFRAAVAAIIAQCRAINGLPPAPDALDV